MTRNTDDSGTDDATDSTVDTKRRGRRGGGGDTREALLEAARAIFPVEGYDRATVRSIARRAGVDPAMVNHWFGGKEGLFTAAVSIPANPAVLVPEFLSGAREEIGYRIAYRFLTVWDEAGGGSFMALVRSITASDEAVRMLREFITAVVFGKLTRELGVDHAELRAALCGSQIVGLGLMRYVVALEPLASADSETVVAAIGPTLQRYLTGDIHAEAGTGNAAEPDDVAPA